MHQALYNEDVQVIAWQLAIVKRNMKLVQIFTDAGLRIGQLDGGMDIFKNCVHKNDRAMTQVLLEDPSVIKELGTNRFDLSDGNAEQCSFVDEIIVIHGEDSEMGTLLREKGIYASGGLSKTVSRKMKKRVKTMHKTDKKNVTDLIKHFNSVGVKGNVGTEY